MSLLLLYAGASAPSSPAAVIAAATVTAYSNLGFNSDHADTIGSYYFFRQPTIDGIVYDETLGRKTRTELTARATSFTTNQRLYGGNTSTGKTALSVFAWVRPTTLSSTKAIASEYLATGDQRSWQLAFSGSSLRVLVVSDGTGAGQKNYISTGVFSTNTWCHIGFVFDNGTLTLYADGKELEVTKSADPAVATLFDSSQVLEVGATGNATGYFEGQIQTPLIHYGAFTAAEVRDLFLGDYSAVQDTDIMWFLDGVNAYPLTSAAAAISLTAANTPTRYEAPEAPDYLNLHGWTGYENLIYPSEDFTSGSGWGTSNGGVRNEDGSFTFPTASSRIQNSQGPFYEIGTAYKIVAQFELQDAGKDIQLIMYHDNSWQGPDVTIDANGIATATITPSGVNGTNVGIRYSTGEVTIHPVSYWIYKEENAASYIETTGATVAYANRPKRINSNLDSAGNPPDNAHSFGECKRNWQLIDGPCISLDGVNQYGVITNTDDYSSEDWVLSGYCLSSSTGTRLIFAQDVGTGVAGRSILGQSTTDRKWFTGIANVTSTFDNITPIIDGREYAFEFSHDASAQSLTLSVTDLVTNVTETETLTSLDMESANGNFVIGSNKLVSGNFWPGKVWGLQLDCTTDPTKSFEVPISDEVATSSKDKSGNGKHIVWQNSPSVSTQDSFFESEANGCSSVPVFVDSVQLRSGSVDYDGLKTSVFEFDFVLSSVSGGQVLYTNGGIAPVRVLTDGTNLNVNIKELADTTGTHTLKSDLAVGVLYQYKIEITEDATNPDTASTIVLSDRITGSVINTLSSLDVNLSLAASNSGNQIIGVYTNFTTSFSGDLYRVRHVAGGVEELLWTADNYLVNQTDDSAMTETGGTLDIKKIPALADGSRNDVNGYPLNLREGSYHHDSQALLEEFPVTDSGSQRAVGYGASFDGTTDANILAETNITSYPFSVQCDVKVTDSSSAGSVVFVSSENNKYLGLNYLSSSRRIQVSRKNGGSTETTSHTYMSEDVWYSIKVTFLSETSLSINVDGVETLFEGEASIDIPAATVELYIGQRDDGLGFSSSCDVKNVIVKQGATVVNDLPLYLDPLDRSSNCNHGTLSATGVSFLTEARETNLNPTIAEAETRSVTSGDRKIIRIGQQ